MEREITGSGRRARKAISLLAIRVYKGEREPCREGQRADRGRTCMGSIAKFTKGRAIERTER